MTDQMQGGNPTQKFLRVLSERAAEDTAYVAWAFRMYADSEGLDTHTIAHRLGVGEGQHLLLNVCRRPSGDGFAAEAQAIADRFKIDLGAFASILRQAEVIGAMRESPTQGNTGYLLAARMQAETEADSPLQSESVDSGDDRDQSSASGIRRDGES